LRCGKRTCVRRCLRRQHSNLLARAHQCHRRRECRTPHDSRP
jgi:hypothetical protein